MSSVFPVNNAIRWMPQGLIDDKSILVQIMAWCHQATNHYLTHCRPRCLSPLGHNESILPRRTRLLNLCPKYWKSQSRHPISFDFMYDINMRNSHMQGINHDFMYGIKVWYKCVEITLEKIVCKMCFTYKGHLSYCVVSTVPADGLAPIGPQASTVTVMTEFMGWINKPWFYVWHKYEELIYARINHDFMFAHKHKVNCKDYTMENTIITSWHGNAFCITDPLWGESNGHFTKGW